MNSIKPYFIRSIYEWITDNHMTPHLLVDAEHPDVVVPVDYIENGKIALNIKPAAVQGLSLENDDISFDASFSGQPMHIHVPTVAVLAIYAKENGKGMAFDPNEEEDDDDIPPSPPKHSTKPNLKIVK